MKFNPNEKAYVEKMINDNTIFNVKYPKNDVKLLLRHFTLMGLDNDSVVYCTSEFMNNHSNIKANWKNEVVKCHNELLTKSILTKPLSNVEKVIITKSEIEQILSLNDDKLEKVAFGLLVYCKIWGSMNGKSDSCWVRIDNTCEFYRDIQYSTNSKTREININKLLNAGLIEIPRKTGSVDIKLNYVDNDSETAIEITSFDDFILDLLKYKGIKIINCKECGIRVIAKGNKSMYCNDCAKNKKRESTRKSVEKHRRMS